jgi:outer membrane protein
MRKLTLAALAAILVLAAAPAHAMRVAYVDVKKAFDAYNGTESAKTKLKKQVEDEKAKLEKEQDGLKKELSDLQAKKSVLTSKKYEEEEAKIVDKIKALQGRIQVTQNDLMGQEQKLTAQIVDLIKEATAKVAKKEKYDFVFESSNILFGGDEITSTVIRELNGK